MADKIKLVKKRLKGDDGYKTFSIRIQKEIVERLNLIAVETGMSRNEIISTFIHFCLDKYEVITKD